MKKFARSFSSLLLVFVLAASFLSGCGQKQIIDLDSIPEYSGAPFVEINGNQPFFESSDKVAESFESYSSRDSLGRCGVAFACIGIDIMPTDDRESITNVTPSGWEYNGVSNNKKYDGEYIYNRCHLIGFQLAGENDNEKNLITGTRYMNIEGMLPFETAVKEYVERTENHVLYRVTPLYDGLNLVASGVLMEALSMEDGGRGLSFCIYAYNVKPGVTINYYTGQNAAAGQDIPSAEEDSTDTSAKQLYILNTSSKKFHYPNKSCSESISEKNRAEREATRDELVLEGYEPCGSCKP